MKALARAGAGTIVLVAGLAGVPRAASAAPAGPAVPAMAATTAVVQSHQVHLAARAVAGTVATVAPGGDVESLGALWDGAVTGTVEVRAHTAAGWSGWEAMEGNPAEGPDDNSPEHHTTTGAGPIWVGHGTDLVQVQVTAGSLRNLRLDAMHVALPATVAATVSAAAHAAGTSPGEPAIISRAAWGADESWRSANPGCGTPAYASSVRNAIIHHTDNANAYSPADSAAMVQAIYHFHVFTNGWCDVGYNFLVDRYGQIFEGRAGGITSAVIGAHAGGFNTGSTGVALIGEFSDAAPTPAMYTALHHLLAWKLALSGVQPSGKVTVVAGEFAESRYPAGTPVTLWTISAHRDVDQTACPGDLAYSEVASLRTDVQRDMAAAVGPPSPAQGGLQMVADDGGVLSFGAAPFLGSMGGRALSAPIVASAETPSGRGYWLVAADGGIFAYGDAGFYGSMGGTRLTQPVVGMAATADAKGYWLVAADGGIFAFGDAGFGGSAGGLRLVSPVVGMAPSVDGRGYWLVAADGGIFAYGDAGFYGSIGGRPLNRPVTAMAATADGRGYWFVATDGGVFAYGDAAFAGSTGDVSLPAKVVAIVAAPGANGYTLVDQRGLVYGFGAAPFVGSAANLALARPVVGATLVAPPAS